MVYFVEEAFQVDVHNVAVTRIDVLLRFLYSLLRIAVWPESLAVVVEFHFELCRQYLPYGLLQHSVGYGGNA